MSVEKLKCPKSYPVLTSTLKYSERDCLQPRGLRKSSVLFHGFDSDQTSTEDLSCAHPCWFSEPKSAKSDCSKWGFWALSGRKFFLLENPLGTWAKEDFWFIWNLILYSIVYIWFETKIWNGSWTSSFVSLGVPTSPKHQRVWKFGGNSKRHPVWGYEASASILYGLSVTQTGFQSLIPSMARTHLIPCSWVPSIGQGCWLEPSRDRLCWNKQMKEQVSFCKGFFIKPFHVYYQPRPGAFMKSGLLKHLQLPWSKLQLMGKSDRRDKNRQGEQDFVL